MATPSGAPPLTPTHLSTLLHLLRSSLSSLSLPSAGPPEAHRALSSSSTLQAALRSSCAPPSPDCLLLLRGQLDELCALLLPLLRLRGSAHSMALALSAWHCGARLLDGLSCHEGLLRHLLTAEACAGLQRALLEPLASFRGPPAGASPAVLQELCFLQACLLQLLPQLQHGAAPRAWLLQCCSAVELLLQGWLPQTGPPSG